MMRSDVAVTDRCRNAARPLRRLGVGALLAMWVAACVPLGGGVQPPSGTGNIGGNGNVPTYR